MFVSYVALFLNHSLSTEIIFWMIYDICLKFSDFLDFFKTSPVFFALKKIMLIWLYYPFPFINKILESIQWVIDADEHTWGKLWNYKLNYMANFDFIQVPKYLLRWSLLSPIYKVMSSAINTALPINSIFNENLQYRNAKKKKILHLKLSLQLKNKISSYLGEINWHLFLIKLNHIIYSTLVSLYFFCVLTLFFTLFLHCFNEFVGFLDNHSRKANGNVVVAVAVIVNKSTIILSKKKSNFI